MSRRGSLWILAFTVAACGAPAPAESPSVEAPPPPAPSLEGELAAIDGRTPVPLLPPMAAHQREQMRDHLVVVQEITAALARDDLDAAAASAARMGTSDSMTAMCTHMGSGAPGFTERALEMHRGADAIAAAAREGDRTGSLRALSETLATCTSCRATYRQELVDHARWTELTATAPPTGHAQ
jgi:hypothetical protein